MSANQISSNVCTEGGPKEMLCNSQKERMHVGFSVLNLLYMLKINHALKISYSNFSVLDLVNHTFIYVCQLKGLRYSPSRSLYDLWIA